MSWVTVLFSMNTSACLTLAVIYGFIWSRQGKAWASLLFALAALGTAALAGFDLLAMRASSPAQFASAILWAHRSLGQPHLAPIQKNAEASCR